MVKRTFDCLLALILFIIVSPIAIVIGILIKVESPGSIIFKQQRIGKDGCTFLIYKFRTMYVGTPNVATHILDKPEEYITKIGRFLRKSSLDELPQLFNIVKGDMSFVGPRPALYNQYDLIQFRRNLGVDKLVPGLTGWAQINGRDRLTVNEKVELDMEYLKRQNFFFDTKILLLTLIYALKAKGIRF